MAALNTEETNHVRMSLLLTGIAPRAVRAYFDQLFPPVDLASTINRMYDKLRDLMRFQKVIRQPQWNLLFPRNGVPDSKTFDVTLMICLIRNLTPIPQPQQGYDVLPLATELFPSADLARIKYYRNYLGRINDGKIDKTYFNSSWTEVAQAIVRLGGSHMKQECEDLKTKILDQSNTELMLETRQMKQSLDYLHSAMETVMSTLEKTQKDEPPSLIRENIFEKLGSTVTLPCQYNDGTEIIIWSYILPNGTLLDYSKNRNILTWALPEDLHSRLSITGNEATGEYNLQIKDLKNTDEGQYRCSRGQNIYKEVNLHIADKLFHYRRMGKAEDFQTLLVYGTYKSYNNIVYLCGACCVGKSTLAMVLLDGEIPEEWFSTNGLDIYYGKNGIDLTTKKMIPLKQGYAGHDVFNKVLLGNPSIEAFETKSEPKGSVASSDVVVTPAPLETVQPDNDMSEVERPATKMSSSKPSPLSMADKIPLLKIHEDILEEIKQGNFRTNIAPSDLVDFGGQKSFDMTHQLFIRQKGCIVVMFDGRYNLDDILPIYPEESHITSRSIIKHWVISILTYCTGEDDLMPVILFAATFSDAFTPIELEERRKVFTEELTKMFSSHEKRHHIMYSTVFFLNATQKEDPEIERLTSKIVDIAMRQKTWGQPMPMAWIPLDLQISQLKTLNENLVKKEDLISINRQNGELALPDRELERYLKAQHSMGKIIYYQGYRLDNFIIIQPPALVNILKAFITDEIFWPKDENLRQIHQKLNMYGKICKQDLRKLWRQEKFAKLLPDDDTIEYIIQILVHLDILIEPKYREGVVTDFFLVPCMAKGICHTSLLNNPTIEERTICLSYHLVNSSVPVTLGFKLIGASLGIWPFKEEDGHPMLLFKSAVLCIDDANDLQIDIDDDRILVYLINNITKHNISPDIAASIQESLTWTLSNAIDFYYSCMGKDISPRDIAELFEIEVGSICQRKVCLLKLSSAEEQLEWTCERSQIHRTKYPKFWVFDKTVARDQCPKTCPGLSEDELSQFASDKHLVRLAENVAMDSFCAFMEHLGLTENELEELEYDYKSSGAIGFKFMALHRWRGKSQGELKNLLFGLKEIENNPHHLCQVFRENTELLGIPQITPDNKVLQELPHNIGNCTIHLGIELGLSVSEIERIIYAHPKDIFEQSYNILQKWKKARKANTLHILMQALDRVKPQGVQFLKQKYNIKITKQEKADVKVKDEKTIVEQTLPRHVTVAGDLQHEDNSTEENSSMKSRIQEITTDQHFSQESIAVRKTTWNFSKGKELPKRFYRMPRRQKRMPNTQQPRRNLRRRGEAAPALDEQPPNRRRRVEWEPEPPLRQPEPEILNDPQLAIPQNPHLGLEAQRDKDPLQLSAYPQRINELEEQLKNKDMCIIQLQKELGDVKVSRDKEIKAIEDKFRSIIKTYQGFEGQLVQLYHQIEEMKRTKDSDITHTSVSPTRAGQGEILDRESNQVPMETFTNRTGSKVDDVPSCFTVNQPVTEPNPEVEKDIRDGEEES